MRFILTLFAATLAVPTTAATQPIPDWPIAPGSRVWILSPVFGNRGATGSVVSATADTLVFRAAKESTSTTIATPHIVRIEVARGTHTNTARFTIGGFLVGAMVGTAIGAATHHSPSYNSLDFSQQAAAFGGGLIGGVAGALVGASIGKRPSDTWVPVALPGR